LLAEERSARGRARDRLSSLIEQLEGLSRHAGAGALEVAEDERGARG